MDSELLVESELKDGQVLINQLAKDNFEVAVAFWARNAEDDPWQLYIASPCVDENRLGLASKRVFESLGKLFDPWITPLDIKLINEANPIARDAVQLRLRSSSPPSRVRVKQLGTLSNLEVYIYPESNSLRLFVTVSYRKQGESNRWVTSANIDKKKYWMQFSGAVGYSTSFWEGEKPEDVKHATVSVLLDIDPEVHMLYERDEFSMRDVIVSQAYALADEMFKARHPDAEIVHDR